jgi:dephospho-CoA kinase
MRPWKRAWSNFSVSGVSLQNTAISELSTGQSRASRPLVIGLTGNIGTGKSTVAGILADLGALIVDADQVAHRVMEPGQPAYRAVIAEFGQEVAPQGGFIDRQVLGQIVFSDPAALARLDEIVHPAVYQQVRRLVENAIEPVVVIEAIKLLEAGLSLRLCDQVWVVIAPRERQIERLMRTRDLSRAEAVLRIDAQPPQSEKVAQADVVIENAGSLDQLEIRVLTVWQQRLGRK